MQLHKRIETTMIYVTHDQIESITLGDRICIMNDGEIEQVGAPSVVFDHPASLFVARFIGSPPMNIFEGVLRRENGGILFDGGTVVLRITGEKASLLNGPGGNRVGLGIRARNLRLADTDESPGNVIEGRLEFSEMLGEETMVHLQNGEHRFVASISLHDVSCLEARDVKLVPDMEKIHVFNLECGRNLTLPRNYSQT
jgi:multiple sugar transport system ATP-binding protein